MARKSGKTYNDPRPQPLKPLTETQKHYFTSLQSKTPIIVAAGSAGTGKTYMPTSFFSDMLKDHHIKQIIVSRPTVECGESLGALPGELEEKFDPWLANIEKIIAKRHGVEFLKTQKRKSNVQYRPIQFMRGETFDDAAIIIDEAQNLTVEQMKMVITRIGKYSQLILCGDTNQSDLRSINGLEWFIREAQRQHVAGVDIHFFTMNDCLRSDVCKAMIKLIECAEG